MILLHHQRYRLKLATRDEDKASSTPYRQVTCTLEERSTIEDHRSSALLRLGKQCTCLVLFSCPIVVLILFSCFAIDDMEHDLQSWCMHRQFHHDNTATSASKPRTALSARWKSAAYGLRTLSPGSGVDTCRESPLVKARVAFVARIFLHCNIQPLPDPL